MPEISGKSGFNYSTDLSILEGVFIRYLALGKIALVPNLIELPIKSVFRHAMDRPKACKHFLRHIAQFLSTTAAHR